MSLEEKILALLQLAGIPQRGEALTPFLSQWTESEINAALLSLAMEGKIEISPLGIALVDKDDAGIVADAFTAPADPEDAEVDDGEQVALFEPSNEEETQSEPTDEPGHEAFDSTEADSVADDEDEMPPWPWPDNAEEPESEPEMPPWPWPEYDNQAESDNDEQGNASLILDDDDRAYLEEALVNGSADGRGDADEAFRRERHIRATDSIDRLDIKANTATKAKAAGLDTVGKLAASLGSLESLGLSGHVSAVLAKDLDNSARPLRFLKYAEQAEALISLSGGNGVCLDLFGYVCHNHSNDLEREFGDDPGSDSSAKPAETPIEEYIKHDVTAKRLRQNGITTMEQLSAKTDEQLLELRNFGLKKLETAREAEMAWNGSGRAAVKRMSYSDYVGHFDAAERALARAAHDLHDPEGVLCNAAIFEVFTLPIARDALSTGNATPDGVVDALSAIPGISDGRRELLEDLASNMDDADSLKVPELDGWMDAARAIASCGSFDFDEESRLLVKHRFALDEWVETLDEKSQMLLKMRFEGKTLQEIGDELEVTRERVRQMVAAKLAKRPTLREDKYLPLIEGYAISEEEFCGALSEPTAVFGYLQAVAATKKSTREPSVKAIADESLSEEIRLALSRGALDGYVIINGVHVKADRHDITYAILAESPDGMSCEDLYRAYMDKVAEHGLSIEREDLSDGLRAYGAWLARQEDMLYAPLPKSHESQGEEVRPYSASGKDFSVIRDFLESGAYDNVECSTEQIMRDERFERIAADLDIRNAYELHTLVRRYCVPSDAYELGRSPMITFGNGSRVHQLEMLIEDLGPIDADGLARAFEERYGVDAFSVSMNYLKEVSSFLEDGMYRPASIELDDGQERFLLGVLPNDVAPLDEIRDLFTRQYPDVPASSIGNATLHRIGYKVIRSLVVREGVDVRDAFSKLIDASERIEEGQSVSPGMFRDDDFKLELNMRLRSFSFVETADGVYESIAAIQRDAPEVSVDMLSDYVDCFINEMNGDNPETVFSMRARGFDHPLHHALSGTRFGEEFLSNVIGMGYVGGRLKRSQMGNTAVFSRRAGAFDGNDLLEFAMRETRSQDVSTIREFLANTFGIIQNEAQLRQRLVKTIESSELSGEAGENTLTSSRVNHEDHGHSDSPDISAVPTATYSETCEEDAEIEAIEKTVSALERVSVAKLLSILESDYGHVMTAVQLRMKVKEADVDFDERRDFVQVRR